MVHGLPLGKLADGTVVFYGLTEGLRDVEGLGEQGTPASDFCINLGSSALISVDQDTMQISSHVFFSSLIPFYYIPFLT